MGINLLVHGVPKVKQLKRFNDQLFRIAYLHRTVQEYSSKTKQRTAYHRRSQLSFFILCSKDTSQLNKSDPQIHTQNKISSQNGDIRVKSLTAQSLYSECLHGSSACRAGNNPTCRHPNHSECCSQRRKETPSTVADLVARSPARHRSFPIHIHTRGLFKQIITNQYFIAPPR